MSENRKSGATIIKRAFRRPQGFFLIRYSGLDPESTINNNFQDSGSSLECQYQVFHTACPHLTVEKCICVSGEST
ncbi:MAG: hypothetical protein P9X24_16655 [Candidatus Hatepunaea meridiana]|nr:hypothetical protein [Candidatus Hatepunaea meridiana]